MLTDLTGRQYRANGGHSRHNIRISQGVVGGKIASAKCSAKPLAAGQSAWQKQHNQAPSRLHSCRVAMAPALAITAFAFTRKSPLHSTPTSMSGRKISKIVPATPGKVTRLIGTLDIDGNGTEHPLDQVDPFMLLDAGTIPKHNMPPFGAHPHRGHSVVSVLLQGSLRSWDSFAQKDTTITGPASYWVDAGSGVFHDETTVIADESDPSQHVQMFQLWISVKEEDRAKPAALQYETNLPVQDLKDDMGHVVGNICYHVGGECTSIKTMHPIVVAHVTQNAGSIVKIPIEPAFGGFIAHIRGTATYGDSPKPTSTPYHVVVLDDTTNTEEEYLLTIEAGNNGASYLVCTGEKIGEPWCKLLAANGAIIAKSETEARDIAVQVEKASKEGLASGNFSPYGAAPKS